MPRCTDVADVIDAGSTAVATAAHAAISSPLSALEVAPIDAGASSQFGPSRR